MDIGKLNRKVFLLGIVGVLLSLALAAQASPDTLLLDACAQGKIADVKDALASGANFSSKNDDGLTPLAIALDNRHVDIARFLLKKGAPAQGVTELMLAALAGDRTKVIQLVDENKKRVNEKDDWGGTALGYAIQNGDFIIFNKLITSGADVNFRYKLGATPLIVAAYHDRSKMVSALISSGAKLEAITKDGFTALSTAAIFGKVESVKALLNADADMEIKGQDGLRLIDRIGRDISALRSPKYQMERHNLQLVYKLLLDKKNSKKKINPIGNKKLIRSKN